MRSAPPWLALALGLACVLLGGYLLVRPLSSLDTLAIFIGVTFIVTGVADLLSASAVQTPRLGAALATAWIVAGVVAILWSGLTISALAVIVGAALIVEGVVRCVSAVRRNADELAAALLLGLASIVLGVLALQWPDVTLLVIAVIFGARTVLFGLSLLWSTLTRARHGEAGSPSVGQPVSRFRRWVHVIGAAVALVAATSLAGVSATIHEGEPAVDAFYAEPRDVPDEPGRLVRSEPFTTAVPEGAEAWRILYTTSRDDDTPALASAIVLTSTDRPSGPLPVVAWAHGTTGFAVNCAPSVLGDPFAAGALPALDSILDNDWILVATDYVGLGTEGPHPYLIGQGEGRSVLDAVRAARQLGEVELADQTVVWGHSQGGHAALWTGLLAPGYAPDADVVGVAAMAPASDLQGLMTVLPTVTGGSVFAAYTVAAYTEIYDDVDFDDYIDPGARTIVREMAERCLAEPGVFVSVLSALSLERDRSIFATDPTSGAFGERLAENTPTGRIEAPLLVAQGLADPLVKPEVQRSYVERLCAAGQPLDYRTYPGFDHVGVVGPDSPLVRELVDWTTDRFAGEPAAGNCDALP